MKKLLLTAAALLAMAGSAPAAPTVHKEAVGTWCHLSDDNNKGEAYYTLHYPGDQKCNEVLVIKADRLEATERGCRYTVVNTWFDPQLDATTKTKGALVSKIDTFCQGQGESAGCTWREQEVVFIEKGVLTFRSRETSPVKCREETDAITTAVVIRGSNNECIVADPTGTPLNVRNRPNGTILGALHNDTRVIVTDSTVASGKVWSKIVPIEAGKAGWVFRSYLDCA
jgi:hypothetical protein